MRELLHIQSGQIKKYKIKPNEANVGRARARVMFHAERASERAQFWN